MSRYDDRTRPARPARRGRRALVVSLLAGVLLAGEPLAALADPTPPSEQDVAAARRAVDAAELSVAQMEVRLAELSAAADEAEVAVARAGEAYTRALSDAEAARAKAADARARSKDADAAAEEARLDLMAFARQMARSGGSTDTLQAVLSADGFADVAARSATLSRLTGKADDSVQTYRAAQLVAETMRRRAAEAADEATAAEAAAQTALDAAEQAQVDADASLQAAAAEREMLIERLAAARQTSAEVEQARQAELDRQRRAREEAAAQAEHQANLPPAGGGSGGSGSGGAASPGTGGQAPGGESTPPPGGDTSGGGSPTPGTGEPTGGTGSSGPNGLGTGRSRGSAAQGQAAVAWAMTQIGKAYVWGATGPDSYDCSGLTMMAWRNAGVNINRTSRDQYKGVLKITYDEMRPGDLVFWTDDPNSADAIYHVAMWAGNGQIVEASRPGVPLRITPMRWANTMPYAGRP